METKTQRNARLKAMRRKYHLGEFKTNRKVNKGVAHHTTMAKRRSTRRTSRKSFSTAGLMDNFVGGVGYVAYENLVSPKIPVAPLLKSFLEIGVGVWASRRGGVVGNVGKMAVSINIYKLMSTYVSPMLSGITGGASSSGVDASFL